MNPQIRFLVLALATFLLAAGTAYAAPSPAGRAIASVAEEFEVIEEAEEEHPAEECAEARAEYAKGEIELEELEAFCEEPEAEGWEAGGSSAPAGECPLRSAHAHAAANDHTLKLTLGYTAYKPFQARLQLSHHLGTFKRHLGRAGVLRFTKQLGHKHPRKLVLQLRAVGAAGCPSPRLVLFPG